MCCFHTSPSGYWCFFTDDSSISQEYPGSWEQAAQGETFAFFFFFKDAEIRLATYSWHLQLLLPWGACSGRCESPRGWWSVRGGDQHIHTFWRGKANTAKERCCSWCVKSWSFNCGRKHIRLSPVAQTSRHADVVKQNQMLDELTEADSSSMRANRHWGKDSSECIVATF